MSHLPVLPESSGSATVLLLLDCNARCPFCSTRVYTQQGVLSPVDHRAGIARRAKDYTLGFDEAKQHLERLKAQGLSRVSFQGGEPTLHPDLPALIRLGWRLGFETLTVVTNGRRLREEALARELVSAAPSTIVLSVFGDRAEEHDASMGVRGAFDDLVEAVRVLRALGAGEPRRRPSLMAQLTLHARNFERLPEMVRFWYAAGLRDFSIRLLRETENTSRGDTDWFFDLAHLRAPLVEALDLIASHADASVSFSELFYCLLPDDRIAHVLRDVGSNPNLSSRSQQVSQHFEVAHGARQGTALDAACAACSMKEVCTTPDARWKERFSDPLRSLDPKAVLARLVAERPAPSLPSIAALLRERVPVPPAIERALRLWLVSESASRGPETLAQTLFSERTHAELKTALRSKPFALRFVPASRVELKAPLPELPRLNDALAPGPLRDALLRLTPVTADPLCAAWLHVQRHEGREQQVVTWLHDDALSPDTIVQAMSSLL